MPGGLEVGTGGDRVLVLLPGFVTPARSYTGLVSPLVVSDPGLRVVVPQLYGIGPGVLTGRYSVAQEVLEAGDLVADLARSGVPCGWPATLGEGRRRGWQPRPSRRRPARGPGPDRPGGHRRSPIGGGETPAILLRMPGDRRWDRLRCAPVGVNHQRFAAAAPRRIHATVPGCGHADVLTGRALRWGRTLCSGGPDPQRARATVTALIAAHLRGELEPHLVVPGPEMGNPSLGRDDRWPTAVVWH